MLVREDKEKSPEDENAEDESDIAEEIKLLHERSLFAHLNSVCLQIGKITILLNEARGAF